VRIPDWNRPPFFLDMLWEVGKNSFLEIPLYLWTLLCCCMERGRAKMQRNRQGPFGRMFEYQSCMTLLWHNTSFVTLTIMDGDLYGDILSIGQATGAWITNLSQVCDWWLTRRNMKLKIVEHGGSISLEIVGALAKFQ